MADTKARIVITADDRTRGAFDSAQRNLAGLAAAARGIITVFGPISAAVATASAALAAINVGAAIELADELGKLSQRSGISVENLSALRFAAKLADVEMGELADSLKKLNVNIAAAARGEKEQAEAFRALGVAVTDASGRVRSADQVLGDVADQFARYADGPNKVAIANAIGGRSFEKLIPLLNGGRKGIADARVELEQYGGVIGGELSRKSEQFNDNITRLGVAFEALKIQLAGGAIDSLVRFSEEMVRASKDGSVLTEVLKRIATFSPAGTLLGALGKEIGFGEENVDRFAAEAQRIEGLMIGVQAVLAREPDNQGALRSLEQLQNKLAQVSAQAQATREAVYAAGQRRPANEGGGRVRQPDAPALARSGSQADQAAQEALAALRKLSEGRVKVIQDGLANERDAYAFHERFLERLYSQGDVALQEFYAAQDETRRTALEATRTAVAAEIAEREKLLASPLLQGKDKTAEREAIRNDIAQARTRLAAAEREFDQAASDSALERQRTSAALRAELQTLQADIAALSGDTSARDLLDIARQVAEARRLLRDSGGDPLQADELGRLLERQRQIALARDNVAKVTRNAQLEEERYLIAAQRRGDTEQQIESGLTALRQRALADLAEQVRKVEELAAAADPDSPAVQFARELRLEFERAAAAADPMRVKLQELRDFSDGIATAVSRSINDAILSGDWRAAGRRIADDITRAIIEEEVFRPLQEQLRRFLRGGVDGADSGLGVLGNAIGGLFGGGGQAQPTAERDVLRQMEAASAGLQALGASAGSVVPAFGDLTPAVQQAMGAFESLPSLLGNLFNGIDFGGGSGLLDSLGSLFLHQGGIAGRDGLPTRYHSGGIAGLQPDEVPAILRRGEEVLTARDPRHRSNGGGAVTVNAPISINLYGVPDRRTREQAASDTARAVQTAIERGTAGMR